MIRALQLTTPYSDLDAVRADDGLWLSGGDTTFRIDERARIVATRRAGDTAVRAADAASADGKPARSELRGAALDAVHGPVRFANAWYFAGDRELGDGTMAVVQPVVRDQPALCCRGALRAIAASATTLAVLVRRDGRMVAACWRTPHGAPAEAVLDADDAWLRAVGPAIVVTAAGRLLVSTVDGTAGWRTLPNPFGMALPHAATHGGRPWLVMTLHGNALLCAVDDLDGLAPGAHPLTVEEHAIAPPGVRVTVKSVGAVSRFVVAIHPAHGRLTFIDGGNPPLRVDEEIEILERGHGASVVWRRPGATAATAEPTTTVLAPPAIVEWKAPAFASSNALARWTARIGNAKVATPPILARLLELYDRSAAARASIVRAIHALAPDAALEDDVVALLRGDGERRALYGFALDDEGIPIGVVAGSDAVWTYDDGALVRVAASAQAWVDRHLRDAAKERPGLVEHVRGLLAARPGKPGNAGKPGKAGKPKKRRR